MKAQYISYLQLWCWEEFKSHYFTALHLADGLKSMDQEQLTQLLHGLWI